MNFPIKVKVKTHQRETKILAQKDNELILAVKSPPEDNKANLEVIKFLSREFKTPLKIVRGLKSKTKILDKLF